MVSESFLIYKKAIFQVFAAYNAFEIGKSYEFMFIALRAQLEALDNGTTAMGDFIVLDAVGVSFFPYSCNRVGIRGLPFP